MLVLSKTARNHLLERIKTVLFKSQCKVLNEQLRVILHKNAKKKGYNVLHQIYYKGTVYKIDECVERETGLDPSLREEMDMYVAAKTQYTKDFYPIDAYITRALNLSTTVADVVDILPNELIRQIPILNNIDRKAEESMLTEDGIAYFKKTNRIHEQRINELLIIQLVTQ